MSLLDLVAKITLDKSDYERGMAGLKADVATKTKALQVGMLKATAAGAAALGAFAIASVKTGATFDKSMSQVAATMGLSMEEMQTQIGTTETAYGHFEGSLRDFAKFMGENTAFSASQAADALNYMALAGYDVEESMSMLPNVLNLAAAGNMELARASDVVTDVQTAFGLQMEEMPQLIDEMAKAASTGNTSVAQLGDAFLTIGGLAQELNGGFIDLADGTQAPVNGIQELEIALTAMANAGIKGSEAGTHMRNMIMKLSSPTSEGTKQLEKMGVTVFDTEGKMRSLSDIFGDLSTKMESMTQEEKIQAISDLFNARDLSSAEALLKAIGEDWDEIGASILDADGAAQKMADTQLDNLSGDITLLKSAFEGFQIQLSDKLTPALRKAVQGVTWLIQNFQKIAPILAGAATAFATFAIAINITSIIRKVAVAMQAFFGLLAANPIALIIAAIAGLVVAFITLYKNNEKFRNKVNAIWDAIKEKVTTVVNGIKEAFQKFMDFIQPIFERISEFFSNLWNGIVESVMPVIDSMVNAFRAGWDLIMTIWNLPQVQAIWDAIKEIILVAWEAIQAVWDIAVGYFKMIWENIKITAATAWSVITGIFQIAWETVRVVWDAAVGFFRNVWDTIAGIFSVVQSVLSGDFRGAWEAIKGIVSGWASYFRGVWNDIKNVFKDATSVGSKIVNDIKSGISSAWGSLVSWVSNAWQSIKSLFVVHASDIQMPSGPGQAIGNDFVPYNNYPALLHRGEAILTAREADEWRRGRTGSGGSGTVINQYIQSVPQTPVQLAAATAAAFEQARWAVV